MSTGKVRVMLCGWEVKVGQLIPYVDKGVGANKTVWYLINMCQRKRFRDEYRT